MADRRKRLHRHDRHACNISPDTDPSADTECDRRRRRLTDCHNAGTDTRRTQTRAAIHKHRHGHHSQTAKPQ
eukprot:1425938-Alexandrium_andersonii.AAC.1